MLLHESKSTNQCFAKLHHIGLTKVKPCSTVLQDVLVLFARFPASAVPPGFPNANE